MNIKVEDESEKKDNIEKVFTGAFHYCLNFMKGNNDNSNDENDNNPLARQSFDYGQEMFEFMLQMYTRIRESTITKSEDDFKRPYFYQQKIAKEFFDINKKKGLSEIESIYVPEILLTETSKSDPKVPEDTTPSPPPPPSLISTPGTSVVQKPRVMNGYKSSRARKIVNNYKSTQFQRKSIPYEEKLRVVNLARKHPNWSQRTLALYSGYKYIRKLSEWKRLVDQGGPRSEKIKVINKIVYERCIEAQEKNQPLSNELIKKWALEVKKTNFHQPGRNFDFVPGKNWLTNFRTTYNIEGRNNDLTIGDSSCVNGDVTDGAAESRDAGRVDEATNLSSSSNKNSYYDEEELEIQPPKRSKLRIIPYEKKAKAVELAVKHPTWTLKRLARNCGIRAIKGHSQIRLWTTQLQQRAQIMQEMAESRSKSQSQNLNNGVEEIQSAVLPEKNLADAVVRISPINCEKKTYVDVVDADCHRGTVNEETEMEVDVKPSPEDLHISSIYSLASSQQAKTKLLSNGVVVKPEPVNDEDDDVMIICHRKSM